MRLERHGATSGLIAPKLGHPQERFLGVGPFTADSRLRKVAYALVACVPTPRDRHSDRWDHRSDCDRGANGFQRGEVCSGAAG